MITFFYHTSHARKDQPEVDASAIAKKQQAKNYVPLGFDLSAALVHHRPFVRFRRKRMHEPNSPALPSWRGTIARPNAAYASESVAEAEDFYPYGATRIDFTIPHGTRLNSCILATSIRPASMLSL
jgi:hypothetical protein